MSSKSVQSRDPLKIEVFDEQSAPITDEPWSELSPVATDILQLADWNRGLALPECRELGELNWFMARDFKGTAAVWAMRRNSKRDRFGSTLELLRSINHEGLLLSDGLVRPTLDIPQLAAEFAKTKSSGGRRWDLIECSGLRDSSLLLRLLRGLPGARVAKEAEKGITVIDTSVEFEAWASQRGAKFMADLRRKRRRLSEMGVVRHEQVTDPEKIAEAFEEFVELEGRGWKAGRGALAGNIIERTLLHSLLRRLASRRSAGIGRLFLEDRLIGSHLWALVERSFFALKIAYDESLSAVAPGAIMVEDLIRQCCSDPGVARMDFGDRVDWLQRWGGELIPTYSVRVPNIRTLKGALRLSSQVLRDRLERR